ncbi:MAG: glycoside hydrolase [Xanthomonadales bacterium]|jgi:hypothetical protein|nr:glycoside hydrolase [Xanthomonadales bacterium]
MTPRTFNPLVIASVALLYGCAPHSKNPTAFGPTQFSVLPQAVKSAPMSIEFTQASVIRIERPVSRARVDIPRAGVRNSESTLALTGYANTQQHDQLVVAWMQMTPDALGIDHTVIRVSQSDDAGQTWQSTAAELPPGAAGDIAFDPSVVANPETGFVVVAGMTNNFNSFATQYPMWESRRLSRDSAFAAPRAIPGVVASQLDRLWLSTNLVGAQQQVVLGATGQPPIWQALANTPFTPTTVDPNCTGIYPGLRSNGVLDIACLDVQANNYTFRSAPSIGADFGSPRIAQPVGPLGAGFNTLFDAIPGSFRFIFYPVFARDADRSRIYFPASVLNAASTPGNVDIALTIAQDDGPFSAPVIINTNQVPHSDQFAPVIAVDPAGGVHIAFLDTSGYVQADSSDFALLDVIYSYSGDGGITWIESKVNAEPINSRNTPWIYPGGSKQQFIGDHIGIAVSPTAAYVSYPKTLPDQMGLEVARIEHASTAIFQNGFE